VGVDNSELGVAETVDVIVCDLPAALVTPASAEP
jgi:hypothetical protein